jgi:hypothetical protein
MKVNFSQESKKSVTNYDYPKLKLEKNERARILLGLEDAEVEYVHTLRKPKIDGDGNPVMITTKRGQRDVTENDMDFISRPLCMGDPSILEDKGSDPKNCTMCALAKSHPDWTKPAERRYAIHVMRYKTQSGKFDVQVPFQVDCVVWSFTDRVYNKLADFKQEHGDLRKHDLLLGPCENPTFQKFDITVGAKAEWLADGLKGERALRTLETFKENKIKDLSVAIGSRKEQRYIDMDIEDMQEAWAALGAAPSKADEGNLDDSLDSLMGSTVAKPTGKPKQEAQQEWSATADAGAEGTPDLTDLLGGLDDSPAEEATAGPEADLGNLEDLLGATVATNVPDAPTEAQLNEAPESEKQAATDPLDFSDLLGA